jgi:hypothetical protein
MAVFATSALATTFEVDCFAVAALVLRLALWR